MSRKQRRPVNIEIDFGLKMDLLKVARRRGVKAWEILEAAVRLSIGPDMVQICQERAIAPRSQEWCIGSVQVFAVVEADKPTWVMRARRGKRWWLDLASGPLRSQPHAHAVADMLNRTDVALWDRIFARELRAMVEGGWT